MPEAPRAAPRAALGSLVLIAAVVAFAAAAFAYTAGWFSPGRLTPQKLVDGFDLRSPPPLGHRRNHAKGICFTGAFESNGAGSELSKAQVFAKGSYPVIGRFNLGTPNPNADDAKERVRGLGVMISTPDGQEWRMAMIDPPFFPVSTPEAFHALQLASASKEPDAMAKFAAANPEIAAFGGWAKSAPWTGSYAEERYNSLNSFVFTDSSGNDHAVRWSFAPAAQPVSVPPEELAKRGPNFLETEITDRIKTGPARWTMLVTVANPGDQTVDPSKAWPEDRRSVDVGTLVVQRIEAEADGPCRDINFDPTVLPNGIGVSDDPFPAARSSAYRVSYDRRTAEEKRLPANRRRGRPMTNTQRFTPRVQRFTPLQRTLHWLMAVCILTMLFIGVGMASSVAPRYLTLVNIHKPLGIAILILALIRLVGAPAFWRAASADRPARADEARGSRLALCALRAHDRDAADRLGDAVGRRVPGGFVAGRLAAADRAAKREPAHGAVERAFLSRLPLFRGDPHACRRGAVPCPGAAGWRVRGHGSAIDV